MRSIQLFFSSSGFHSLSFNAWFCYVLFVLTSALVDQFHTFQCVLPLSPPQFPHVFFVHASGEGWGGVLDNRQSVSSGVVAGVKFWHIYSTCSEVGLSTLSVPWLGISVLFGTSFCSICKSCGWHFDTFSLFIGHFSVI